MGFIHSAAQQFHGQMRETAFAVGRQPELAGIARRGFAFFAGQRPGCGASDTLLQVLADLVVSAIVGPQFAER